MRERKIEKYFREQVAAHGGMAFKFVSPQKRGVTDQLAVWPGGEVHFVELKNETGRPSALQVQFSRELRALNAHYYILKSFEEIGAYIEEVQDGRI